MHVFLLVHEQLLLNVLCMYLSFLSFQFLTKIVTLDKKIFSSIRITSA